MKPLALAIALSLALAAPLSAPAQTATPTAAAKAAPEWVNTSNRYAQILLEAQLRFQPESASFFGIPGYDDKIADLVREQFALTPKGIMTHLKLIRPIYTKTAAYGHFGREDKDFTWEKKDKAAALKKAR